MEEIQEKSVRVSAVVVSYNSAAALRTCLEALERSQDRERLEILVVDCGSRDESPRLDTDFPNAQFLRLPRHFGFTKARNIAVRTAAGEFILFLDPEVEVAPSTISSLAAQLASDPDLAAVCPVPYDPAGQPIAGLYDLPTPRSISRAWHQDSFGEPRIISAGGPFIDVEHAPIAALMVRTYFIKGINYLDQRFPHSWADTDLCFQIWRASKKIRVLPEARVTWYRDQDALRSLEPGARSLLSSDYALGAVSFTAKYSGFFAGAKARLAVIWNAFTCALGALLRARDVGYQFSRLSDLLGSRRLDGTQREF
jgi:N-acetylglucosaminyl-diphospho-decaprenol L-rhamnosyltransferase